MPAQCAPPPPKKSILRCLAWQEARKRRIDLSEQSRAMGAALKHVSVIRERLQTAVASVQEDLETHAATGPLVQDFAKAHMGGKVRLTTLSCPSSSYGRRSLCQEERAVLSRISIARHGMVAACATRGASSL